MSQSELKLKQYASILQVYLFRQVSESTGQLQLPHISIAHLRTGNNSQHCVCLLFVLLHWTGKFKTGDGSAFFVSLEKPVWRPKGRQLSKFIIQYSDHHLNTRPFDYQTTFGHSNTRLVRYSDPHSTRMLSHPMNVKIAIDFMSGFCVPLVGVAFVDKL